MSLAPARRRLVLSAVVAALAVSALVAMVVARTTGDRVTPVAQGQQGPVLLVSGYGGSTGSLEPVRAALEETGRDVIVVPPVGGGTGDLEVQARSLGNAAAAARARSGRRRSTWSATRRAAWSPGPGCATTAAPRSPGGC